PSAAWASAGYRPGVAWRGYGSRSWMNAHRGHPRPTGVIICPRPVGRLSFFSYGLAAKNPGAVRRAFQINYVHDRLRIDLAEDMREVLADAGVFVADGADKLVGIDDQHAKVRLIAVERSGHPRDLFGERAMDESLSGERVSAVRAGAAKLPHGSRDDVIDAA